MKITKPINQLSALIGVICFAPPRSLQRARICALVLCGLILLPLTLTAQEVPGVSITALNSAITATGTSYSQFWQATSGTITGLDNTTFSPVNAYNPLISSSNNSLVTLGNDTTIDLSQVTSAVTNYVTTLYAGGTSTLNVGDNLVIDDGGISNPVLGINIGTSSTLNIGANAHVTATSVGSYAVNGGGNSTLTFGDNATLIGYSGIYLNTVTLALNNNATISTTDSTGVGLTTRFSSVTGTNASITSGRIGLNVQGNSTVQLTGGSITTWSDTGDYTNYAAVALGGGENTSTVELTDVNINAVGLAIAVRDQNQNSNLIINGGSITSQRLLAVSSATTTSVSGSSNIIFNNTDLTDANDILITEQGSANLAMDITVNGGSGIHGDITNNGSSSLGLNLNDSSVTGNIQNNSDGTLNLDLNDSSVTGNINNNNGTVSSTGTSVITGDVNSSLEVSSGTLTVTGSVTVDSGHSVTGNGTLTVGGLEINDGGTLGGGLTLGTTSAERILIGLSSATLYHEFGSLTEIGADTLKLGDNIALDLSGIDDLSGFTFVFTDDVQNGNFTLILGEAGSLENWAAEISGSISGLTLSGQNEVTADITITLNGDNSALTATLSNVTVNAVPEPSTYFLIGTGLGLLLLTARCRRQAGTDA